MCNTKCQDIARDADRKELAKKDTLTLGGIVTNVNARLTKTGKPMGIVTIEDFEGMGEIAMFGDDWANWSGKLQMGYSVYVKLKCQERFQRGSGIYDLRVQSIEFLQDVVDKYMETVTIHINLNENPNPNDENEEEEEVREEVNLADLATIITESPGKTRLQLSIRDNNLSSVPVMMTSQLPGIKVNRRLVDYVKTHKGMSITL